MNSGFYKDLDLNFREACEMSEKEFSHEELINMLETGNIPQKQIAALRLDIIKDNNECQILINNLTGCDGKIREAVALRINQLLLQNDKLAVYFYPYPEIFADSAIDINGNICRLAIDSAKILIENSQFLKIYSKKIINFITDTYMELDKFIFKDKKYIINKQLFKLYWSLEALKLFASKINQDSLFEILKRASNEREYTIREKAAQIVNNLNDKKFENIKNSLKNDENYYVREVFNN